jgi:hypothetical protein
MNAAAVLRSARADGLKLTVSETGAVKLSGSRGAVDRWVPAITSNKPDIVALLRQEADGQSEPPAIVLESQEAVPNAPRLAAPLLVPPNTTAAG